MKQFVLLLYICLLPYLSGAQTAKIDPSWELTKTEDGIMLYRRPYKNTGDKEVLAVMTVSASLSALVALIKDDEAAPQWINRMKTFQTLPNAQEAKWYTYGELSLPFPYYNRDLVSENILTQNKQTKQVQINIRSRPQYQPEVQGKVRIVVAEGAWIFTPLPNKGGVEVQYMFYAASNISLPKWVTEPLVIKGIISTMRNMRLLLQQPKYAQTRLSYIEE
jgi:hypothetical protein